jgi:hypothetical protein
MGGHYLTQLSHKSRHDACARVCGDALVAVAHVAGATMLGTVFTTKINPRWASGGLPREGNS